MKAAELTPKQARFVQEYLVDGNGAQAALRAGYGAAGAKVTACRLLTRPNLRHAIEVKQTADAARLSLRREDVLAGLLEAVDQARVQSNPMAMIAGLREIGKMMGFYAVETKRVELAAGQGATQRHMESMTDAQLYAIVGGMAPVDGM